MTRFLAIAVALFWTSAEAHQRCGLYAQIKAGLENTYNEHVAARWNGPSHVTELWANDTTGTWTLVHAKTDGTACIIGSARNFHNFEVLHKEGEKT